MAKRQSKAKSKAITAAIWGDEIPKATPGGVWTVNYNRAPLSCVTLRNYFAGQALSGILARSDIAFGAAAISARAAADALIEEMDRTEEAVTATSGGTVLKKKKRK